MASSTSPLYGSTESASAAKDETQSLLHQTCTSEDDNTPTNLNKHVTFQQDTSQSSPLTQPPTTTTTTTTTSKSRYDDEMQAYTTPNNNNETDSETPSITSTASSTQQQQQQHQLRRIAIDMSLYTNLFILLIKIIAYIETLSLSVLASLTDSFLDVISQLVLNYTERHSSLSRSSALYPAGASRLEPVGVLTCAALMGMASFEIIKESIETLLELTKEEDSVNHGNTGSLASLWGMVGIIVVKLLLLVLCQKAANTKVSYYHAGRNVVQLSDPTLEALAQDHWNDALSNTVASIALLCALESPSLWYIDPVGAIVISLYIIHSWYETGKEQIEQLTGKSAPDDFIESIRDVAANFDTRMVLDVCRAYHFGPKFLVEIEVVLPRDTLLFESHDLGMELQYEIEAMEEVERCFVHIDYEQRPYDEHVVSKVPELREKYQRQMSTGSCYSV